MAVVINEFEIVPQDQPPREAPPQEVQRPAKPRVREIEQIVRRQMERAARLRAH